MANEKLLIDANALISNLRTFKGLGAIVAETLVRFVKKQPTVDAVEVVHGRWENLGGHRKMDLRCSVCNKRASNFVGGYEDWWDLWFPKYCPNCGAKMDGGNEDGC